MNNFQEEKNTEFISDFEEWLANKDGESNREKFTSRKITGYLFSYPESLLAFNSNKYEDYHLYKHVSNDVGEFIEVCNPILPNQWIHAMGGADGKQHPAKRREMLKAHARFRDFVYEKVSLLDFGRSVDDLRKKGMFLKSLNEITNHLKKRKVFEELSRLEENERKLNRIQNRNLDE